MKSVIALQKKCRMCYISERECIQLIFWKPCLPIIITSLQNKKRLSFGNLLYVSFSGINRLLLSASQSPYQCLAGTAQCKFPGDICHQIEWCCWLQFQFFVQLLFR